MSELEGETGTVCCSEDWIGPSLKAYQRDYCLKVEVWRRGHSGTHDSHIIVQPDTDISHHELMKEGWKLPVAASGVSELLTTQGQGVTKSTLVGE